MSFQNDVIEGTKQIIVALQKEGDRGCVLVAAALLEDAIEQGIAARLIENQDKNDLLMSRSGNAPISAFSSKIELYYRIGLCTDRERKLYHQLRNLRNDCAHRTDEQDFSKASFKHRIENIIAQSENVWEAIKSQFGDMVGDGDPIDTIHDFVKEIGWRPAFTLFFAFLISLKYKNVKNIRRIKTNYRQA